MALGVGTASNVPGGSCPRRRWKDAVVAVITVGCSLWVAAAGAQEVRPSPGMLRYPDVSRTHVVFAYGNDLWVVPKSGGLASPLVSPPGQERFPRFSGDGQTIAFEGNYDGGRDLYTIPLAGGIAQRVTHEPGLEMLCDWMPDGQLLFASNVYSPLARVSQLYRIVPGQPLPVRLPMPYGASAAVSGDGSWVAYTPWTADERTWKRYRGGMATDVWLFNLADHSAKRITDWEGTDTQPMWQGQTVFYLSDQGESHRLNIWAYDTTTGARRQVTSYADADVKWPSIGPGDNGQGEIIFQLGAQLMLLDLGTGQARAVEVTIPGDRPTVRARTVDASKFLASAQPSATGKRLVVEARGDLWSVPVSDGSPWNMTRTNGVAERDPAWSPDGRWIAYFADATGEYELYLKQSDGKGETRQLTADGQAYRYAPTWSPDSKQIAFTDKSGRLLLHTVESKTTRQLDQDPWAARLTVSWSHDSNWLAYARRADDKIGTPSIWLYDLKADQKHQVTEGFFSDASPAFDREGKYLYFATNRSFTSPIYEDLGTSWIYANSELLVAVPLRRDVKNPLLPKSDEEKWGEAAKPGSEKKEAEKKDDPKKDEGTPAAEKKDAAATPEDKKPEPAAESKPAETPPAAPPRLVIDLDGLAGRMFLLPVKPGNFRGLEVNAKNQLMYLRGQPRGMEGRSAIELFDLNDEKKAAVTVLEGVQRFQLTADGKKMLVGSGPQALHLVDAAPGQKLDKPVSLAGLNVTIDPRVEWKQIFLDAWRIERDFFYDPQMHGVDWLAVRQRYEPMLADCASREDVAFVISEMIAELNVGHAYYRGGETEEQPNSSSGMLGCEFELQDGAFRLVRFVEGASWDLDARNPLRAAGVQEGEYLLAVNRVPLDPAQSPYLAFQGLAGRAVTLTVSDVPQSGPKDRDVVVTLLGGDRDLRYRAGVEARRKYVSDHTGGRVGYIYVPDTGVGGQNELVRQFVGQLQKDALIIDDRWNGGGQIPTRFIELLNRPVTNYWARRDGRDWTWPPDAHHGPKCMLINGLAGSGGDMFPALFRQSGLGKLIGTRTWGGLVGISGNPQLIDGAGVTAPTFAFYEKDGTWGIEGHGVDPDIEVIDDPALLARGTDPQLDAAIKLMLEELERHPYRAPARPAYPDRSQMGIKPEDK